MYDMFHVQFFGGAQRKGVEPQPTGWGKARTALYQEAPKLRETRPSGMDEGL